MPPRARQPVGRAGAVGPGTHPHRHFPQGQPAVITPGIDSGASAVKVVLLAGTMMKMAQSPLTGRSVTMDARRRLGKVSSPERVRSTIWQRGSTGMRSTRNRVLAARRASQRWSTATSEGPRSRRQHAIHRRHPSPMARRVPQMPGGNDRSIVRPLRRARANLETT